MINICYRKELNMRKGKLAAQVSHAVMSIFRQYLSKSVHHSILIKDEDYDLVKKYFNFFDPKYINNFLELVSLSSVNGEKECGDFVFHHESFVSIIDSGFTEFGGKKTLTCSAFIDGLKKPYYKPSIDFTTRAYRQMMIVNSDIQQDKEELALYSAFAFLSALFVNASVFHDPEKKIYSVDLSEGILVREYFFGYFTKIVLKANTEEIYEIKKQINEDFYFYGKRPFIELNNELHHSICFSPNTKFFFDNYTEHLKLI